MSDINKLVFEELDILGSIGGTIAGSYGGGTGSHISTVGIKDPVKREKMRRLAGLIGYGTGLTAALKSGEHFGTPGFITGDGLGYLAGSALGGKILSHYANKKKK